MKKIRTVIFDLDNCLAPVGRADRGLFNPLFEAITAANHGCLNEKQLAAAFADVWRLPLDVIEARHGFSPEMKSAGRAAYRELRVTAPMFGYPDLPLLAQFPTAKFLVTTGFRRLQESKIEALGIGREFDGVHIDEVEDSERRGKIGCFAEILQTNDLHPEEVLVVGDNPESEIDAGNRLGIPTVQILRPGIAPGGNAAFYVRNLAELLQMTGARSPSDVVSPKEPAVNGWLLSLLGALRFPPAPSV